MQDNGELPLINDDFLLKNGISSEIGSAERCREVSGWCDATGRGGCRYRERGGIYSAESINLLATQTINSLDLAVFGHSLVFRQSSAGMYLQRTRHHLLV